MKTHRQRGITLLEITIAMGVVGFTSVALAASLMGGAAANRRYQENTIVMARAQHYLETLFNLQIGIDADSAATQAELDTVFSGDPEVGNDPPSLVSLARAIDAMAGDVYEFAPPGLGFPGNFLVVVSNNVEPEVAYGAGVDPDGDGAPDEGASMAQGSLDEQFPGEGVYESDSADQGRELFAFEIWFRPAQPAGSAPRLVLRGFRAQDL